MPRNMSFMHTKRQMRERSKIVTRRLGWRFLKPGEVLNACEKCQGLKRGEKVKKIGQICVVSAEEEPLNAMIKDREYGRLEATREGFPGMTGKEFVEMFCRLMGCEEDDVVTRIMFHHLGKPQKLFRDYSGWLGKAVVTRKPIEGVSPKFNIAANVELVVGQIHDQRFDLHWRDGQVAAKGIPASQVKKVKVKKG